MLTVFKDRPSIVIKAREAKFKPHFFIQVLIFIGVYLATQMVMAFPLFMYGLITMIKMIVFQTIPLDNLTALTEFLLKFQNELILPSLIGTVLTIFLTISYCMAIEKRSLYSMGFVREKAVTEYLTGAGIGIIMFIIAVLIAYLCGTLTYNGYVLGNGIYFLLAFLVGFIIQGMSEEVFLRGYFMISVASKNSILLAVLSNSMLFALLHIFNNGIDLLSFINIILFGLFASIYVLKTDSIWGICALHTTWNFTQGNIFGIKVSGIDAQVSLFSFVSNEAGSIINGGAFGLEGGLAVTTVLVISTVILLSIDSRNLNNEASKIID